MGVVYRATELSLGRPVALKLLAPERARDEGFRERFQRESRMAAAIDHPNVIPVYAAGEHDGSLYLVMRYVSGTDLHALLRESGALSPARAADVVAQVAAALDAAHRAGLVHRDVKPANVLLAGEHAYLSDFGLTRLAGSDSGLTESGQWLGTVEYCSPEQLRGRRTDARADVYSLGCVLFAALTGGPPFAHGTVPATMLAHLNDPPPRPSSLGVPAEFDRVIARALAKAPEDRYPSAGDLGRAALAAARGEPVTESERSVAVGPAAPSEAPTVVNGGGTAITRWDADAHEEDLTAATAVASPPPADPPLEPHQVSRRAPLAVPDRGRGDDLRGAGRDRPAARPGVRRSGRRRLGGPHRAADRGRGALGRRGLRLRLRRRGPGGPARHARAQRRPRPPRWPQPGARPGRRPVPASVRRQGRRLRPQRPARSRAGGSAARPPTTTSTATAEVPTTAASCSASSANAASRASS